ncbi:MULTISPECIES: DUF1156 domain-containing protein [Pseudanabaena]|uniref:DUF1156 domain-containing protein n=1 Tax=Pseudanabaena TaxID=1152 RepID=UPI00247936FD|nr:MULTISPECIES: DUF1156 domain-containing protein [Pseudanabaena]MEA5490111.1 DUF1156 domain-containing protein [Pseudanabaena sp. CCNP1317]WGS71656.1 DUF1156 domain-containing protein [Pseudanabaena galeata CCNP1313]
MTYKKKLIEVALPLEAINKESAREKSIRHGHPSTLHLWWARRPLAACRAVLFASLVDDPSSLPDEFPTEDEQNIERLRLFGIIERLVKWENINNQDVLNEARAEILKSTNGNPPPVYDPFCGGGSIPLEAQRLGLEAHGSDLNPVAVLITKALIEIPPKFKDLPPVNPASTPSPPSPLSQGEKGNKSKKAVKNKDRLMQWYGAQGLADDVRYYGAWMRDEAFKKIGHLYPKVSLTPQPPLPEGEGESDKWEFSVALQKKMQEIAQQFRKEPTESESILWDLLRNRKLDNRKFRRQHPIGRFVVDFYCHEERLIVEIDGGIHASQQDLDRQRQEILESLGLRFVRISSNLVETNPQDALQKIRNAFLPPSPSGRGAGGEGNDATVIAWIWARTVKCPNPSCGCAMPLVRSFALSTKKGKEAWIEYEIERSGDVPKVIFTVKSGTGEPPEGTVSRKGARCIACESDVKLDHVRAEGKAGRMGAQLMAIVAEGNKGRLYLSPNDEQDNIANSAQPTWKPETELVPNSRHVTPIIYGMTKHSDLFTSRQLVALTTFSDLVKDAREKVIADGGAEEYANAVATYLAFAVDRIADNNSTICSWNVGRDGIRGTFARQAIQMTWDFAETNPLSDSTGNFLGSVDWVYRVLQESRSSINGFVKQQDAVEEKAKDKAFVFSTDPPYYDAVPYADLSDFFYVWLRKSLNGIYSELCSTLLVPKSQEMVADHFRHGSKEKAKEFFEDGLSKVFQQIRKSAHPDYPFTVYYAFKQTESDDDESDIETDTNSIASTGWETMLEGLIQSSFAITGTIPVRTERSARSRGIGSNALASSIVLVCRPRPDNATSTTRRQFLNELKRELPDALKKLQQGNIAPVDLAQASIGPGMAVYSKYAKVLEPDGSAMRVRTALQLINQALDEYFAEQEGEFDTDTRWALAWFEQSQFNEGAYGDAETLSTAKNISVQGLVNSGILFAKGGKVRLLKRDELPTDWNPDNDNRTPAWEVAHHLIRALDKLGERGAANLLAQVGIDKGEIAKDLSYRLYSICDRKGWTQLALDYNSLVISWQAIVQLAIAQPKPSYEETPLFNLEGN